MKNIIKTFTLIAIMELISFNVMAQKAKDVPQAVQDTFATKYPKAQLKDWKEKRDGYVVFFAVNNRDYDAVYSKDGNWLNTERDIKRTTDLPEGVRDYLKTTTYASWHIDGMKRVRMPMQNIYQVTLDNHSGSPSDYEGYGGEENRMLSFNDSGKLLKVTSN